MMIRDVIAQDVDGMIAIDPIAAIADPRRQEIREWVRNGGAIAAVMDGRVVGYGVLDYRFFGCGFISMLIVDAGYRRRGVAIALVRRLEEKCETAKLFTSTNESNAPMRGLMAKLSYIPSGIVHHLDDGDPELFFFKRVRE